MIEMIWKSANLAKKIVNPLKYFEEDIKELEENLPDGVAYSILEDPENPTSWEKRKINLRNYVTREFVMRYYTRNEDEVGKILEKEIRHVLECAFSKVLYDDVEGVAIYDTRDFEKIYSRKNLGLETVTYGKLKKGKEPLAIIY